MGEQMSLTNNDLLSLVHRLVDPDLRKRLPEKYGNISPLDVLEDARDWILTTYDPDDGQKYNELHDEFECHGNELLKLVPVDKRIDARNVLNDYTDCMTDLGILEKRNLYKIGLRDGFLLAVELLVVQGENRAVKRVGIGTSLDRHKEALKRAVTGV